MRDRDNANPLAARIRQWVLRELEKPDKGYQQRGFNNLTKLYAVIRPGDVLLVEGRSEMSRIIKLFSASQWSHAALYIGDALIGPGSNNRDRYLQKYGDDAHHMLIEAFSGQGVIASPVRKYKDFNIRLCRPYGISSSDLDTVIAQVIRRLGRHYDDQNISDIAWMALRSVFRLKNKHTYRACLGNCNDYQVICSGIIAKAFQSVGYPIVPALEAVDGEGVFTPSNPYGSGLRMRHFTQITPKDFDLSPNFEIIKFNLIGTTQFDYKRLWVEKIDP